MGSKLPTLPGFRKIAAEEFTDKQRLIDSILRTSPVMPVIVIDQVEQAVPLAKTLLAGGIRVQ